MPCYLWLRSSLVFFSLYKEEEIKFQRAGEQGTPCIIQVHSLTYRVYYMEASSPGTVSA